MKPRESDPSYPFAGAVCVQPVSVDEVFLEYPQGTDGALVAASLRAKIFDVIQCTASAGIGPNMLLARLATKKVIHINMDYEFFPSDISYIRVNQMVSLRYRRSRSRSLWLLWASRSSQGLGGNLARK
jgi:hypothetical protein